ncbi:unnamed protein product, partial [Mesorhabditis belari]|uniref:Uncharacterized protein n=1 Tax=Mesorhabditis belari TaxID=2138241 RepID=A0AAF3J434_9BILA
MPGGRMPMQRGFENSRSDSPSTSFRSQQGRNQAPPNQFTQPGPNQQFPIQRYGFFTANSTPQTAVYQLKHQKNEPPAGSQVNGFFNKDRLTQPLGNTQQTSKPSDFVQSQGNNEIEARAQAIPLNAAENENELLVRLLYTHLEKIRDPTKQLRLRNELLSRVQEVLEEQLAEESPVTEETRKRKSDTAWMTQGATQPSPPQPSQIQAAPEQQKPSNQSDSSPFVQQELTGTTFQPSYPRNQHFLT